MKKSNDNFNLVTFFKKLFAKSIPVLKDDIGIYHYVWSCSTFDMDTREMHCDVYLKVKAIQVYDDLVEIVVIDTSLSDYFNRDVLGMIKSGQPKYVSAKKIKWCDKC